MNVDFNARIKRRSQELIGTVRPSPLVVSIIWFLINAITGLLIVYLSGYYDIVGELDDALFGSAGAEPDLHAIVERNTHTGGILLSVMLAMLATVIVTGFKWYCLRVARGESPEIRSVFDGFYRPLRILWLLLVKWLLIAVWTLFFIVPGVLAIIRYSQAEYIYYDHPEYGAMKCLRESGRLINGYKTDFLIFALSFAGWVLCGIIVSLFIPVPVIDIWVSIYWGIAAALFHTQLRARSIKQRKFEVTE